MLNLVAKYALGLFVLSLIVKLSIRPFPQLGFSLGELITVIMIFIFGYWIGYTWHNYRLEDEKRKLIWNSFSQREQEVARLILKGMNNQEICEALFIENNTVKTHLRKIYRKSNCSGRKELRALFNA